MKCQERGGAKGDGELSDASWTEEERRQTANQPVAQREVRRPRATTTKNDQLLLEHEILGDHGSHATGATQLRSHNGEVQQGDQEVLHKRVSVGRTPGVTQRCPIRESARELAIRDPQDPSVHHGTLRPQKLLKNDGIVVTQLVESVRRPASGLDVQNGSFRGGTRLLTMRSFLSANAIHSEDSMDRIDWCSSNNSTDCALGSISVPVLIAAMGGHYFIRDSEIHYEMAASKDKDFIVIEGATHGGTPCTACETTPGQYSNSARNFFDYVAKWIDARY
jgi:hypothetical protein